MSMGINEVVNKQAESLPPLGVSGLGGWLIIVQMGLFATVAMNLAGIYQSWDFVFAENMWDMITTESWEFYHPLLAPTILFEIVLNLVVGGLSIFALVQMYRKKSSFPKLIITLYIMFAIIQIIDYALIMQIPLLNEMSDMNSPKDLVRSILNCVVWIPYFLRSERVQNTFRR
ncbi:DUF2569 domain-containing protein [Paenibacillus sp. UMB4589-SE434]|uniref:DUF2569 domain-containing protein n=1 Tax=Paenibacillus sp. UMB4589-SE434 TaxID=3046314 RepID=UPI00254D09FC|nr:DUF2569 domain-containing protein [Paenibacillus sp. UMB4589-SE434]MDK8180555.1 DUF2569 domain-containing protein [Paenibacillus sp. UMB4589-SE434]